MKAIPWRAVAAGCIIVAGFCFVTILYSINLTNENAASRDYIGYWAAGQQMVLGASPYDAVAVLRMEKAVGLGNQQIRITPSPPLALSLLLPLGFLSAKAGLVFWLMAQIAALSSAIGILWLLQGSPPTRIHLFGYFFAPAAACIMAGQMGIFFLLGIVLFLYLRESWPVLAGAALLPCALKPHLFLPIAIVFVMWVVIRKAPRLLLGFFVALIVSYAAVLHFDPHAWSQYMEMMRTTGVESRFAPTLSANLRLYVAPQAVWLQYLPTFLACGWAAWYFFSRRDRWSWIEHGMLVLLISLLCAPYAWITDESVLLPAVLIGLYRAIELKRSVLPIVIFAAAALIELLSNVPIIAWYYMWTVPAWLGWFVYATRLSGTFVNDRLSGAGLTTK